MSMIFVLGSRKTSPNPRITALPNLGASVDNRTFMEFIQLREDFSWRLARLLTDGYWHYTSVMTMQSTLTTT